MELKSKYIKDTNDQYSIRENGQVIIHYRLKRITNTRKDKIYCNDILKTRRNCVNITINQKIISFSVNTLLFKYFNCSICNQCNSKFKPDISLVKYNKCRKSNRLKSSAKYSNKYYKDNTEECKLKQRLRTQILDNSYIANSLYISINILTAKYNRLGVN